MKVFNTIFFILLSAITIKAADRIVSAKIDWNPELSAIQVGPDKYISTPGFVGAAYPEAYNNLPVYVQSINLPYNADLNIRLINVVYQPLAANSFINKNLSVKNNAQINYVVGQARKQYMATIEIVPIIKNNSGEYKRLVSFDLEIDFIAKPQQYSSRKRSSFKSTNQSVLSSGTWYKIGVNTTGIFKIDETFLTNLGINTSNIDPRTIKIYGNGGGMLPEANSEFRHDDLVENAIFVAGESDGSFDAGDYILFYGDGPHQIVIEDNKLKHIQNVYSDYSYYFITYNGLQGKRLSTLNSTGISNKTVTSFNDCAFHESDQVNLINSGRQWFGDYFTFNQTARTFSFNFPNIINTEPVIVDTRMCARSIGQSASFSVNAGGQNINNFTISSSSVAYLATYAKTNKVEGILNNSSSTVNVVVNLNTVSSNTEGWLDYITVNARRSLTINGTDLLLFRDLNSVDTNNIAEFVVSGANSSTSIWEITNPVNATKINYNLNGSQAKFTLPTDELREFIAFNSGTLFGTPTSFGNVANQNLHGLGQKDMLIVAGTHLMNSAETLANYHRLNNGLTVAVVDINKVYNEFSSGSPDVTAIRDFTKMFYDRAGTDPNLLPKYLLLFGDGSFDYKNYLGGNSNIIPTYESVESLAPVSTYCTDDYFALLDDTEGGDITSSSAKLDIAVGRLPVNTVQEATGVINKITNYQSTTGYGNWRNVVTFVADDGDGNVHVRQADGFAKYIEDNHRVYNIDKIYLDAFVQVSSPGGTRYPDVNDAINRRMFSGTLMMSYTGHGGTNGWAHERVLDFNDINSWTNFNKLPLFLTATCEFSKFDDPGKLSAGEQVFLNPNGGAIAMVTTVRVVYSGANAALSIAFIEAAFESYDGIRMPTMGEALMKGKNNTSASTVNTRKFLLLGDPAVTLAYPRYNVVTTSINGMPVTQNVMDTIKALEKVTIRGEVRDDNGNKMSAFDGGIAYPTIFDKALDVTTLANDGGGKVTFKYLKSIIFNGKSSINNGEFEYTFIVPKDISFNLGQGKISYYAQNKAAEIDAHGYTSELVIGGTADTYAADGNGPDLDVFMNDESFVFGGTTDENPLLLIKLFDFSGINTAGNGIGHDITGVLDDDNQATLVLNEYYESEIDNYQMGEVKYPLSELEDGRHTMAVKAWDVYNNSADGYTEFIVASSAELALAHVLNYPNPFTTNTDFHFEHNRPGENLFVQVKIFTVSGKLVKTIQHDVISDGYRVSNINWDGLDDFGDKIGRGAYVYKLSVSTPEGESAHKFEKLVILR